MPAPDPLDLKMCNCRQCGKGLLGRSVANRELAHKLHRKEEVLAGRIHGIPYCKTCLKGNHGRTGKLPTRPERQVVGMAKIATESNG